MSTLIHVTHEAVQKIGGIGAVLQGLLTAKSYNQAIKRTILVGPLFSTSGSASDRLGKGGEVFYSSIDGLDKLNQKAIFRPIEEKFQVWFVYGRRLIEDRVLGVQVYPEVLLVEPSMIDKDRLGYFKTNLYRRFGIQSDKYESNYWEYDLYVRLAEPAYEAIKALLADDKPPHYIIAHEFMGMPLALKGILENDKEFATIFYGHEVATMRPVVEGHSGHDTRFYNVLDKAISEGKYIEDVFGAQTHFFKHALINNARFCDNIFAVGDLVVKELKFLGPNFNEVNIDLVYNGVPAFKISVEEKFKSKEKLQKYAEALLGSKPDYIFSHVTRLVTSKGLWRDLSVLEHLDPLFAEEGLKGVIFFLSSSIGTGRPGADIMKMEAEYGWPLHHREGHPDLVGDEIYFSMGVAAYNKKAKAIKAVFVNQFGWSQDRCGKRMPADMEFMDIRKGTDVEFGQSIYEPFGIAQVEPISFGAICVISNVCGCAGFVEKASGGQEVKNVIVADYTRLPPAERALEELLNLGFVERNLIEASNSKKVAQELFKRLPRSEAEVQEMLDSGCELGSKMSWEVVVSDYLIPGLNRAKPMPKRRRRAKGEV